MRVGCRRVQRRGRVVPRPASGGYCRSRGASRVQRGVIDLADAEFGGDDPERARGLREAVEQIEVPAGRHVSTVRAPVSSATSPEVQWSISAKRASSSGDQVKRCARSASSRIGHPKAFARAMVQTGHSPSNHKPAVSRRARFEDDDLMQSGEECSADAVSGGVVDVPLPSAAVDSAA